MWWILACTSPSTESGVAPWEPGPQPDAAPEVVPGVWARGDCDALYDPDGITAYALELTDDDWQSLQGNYSLGVKAYHPATLHVGDEVVDAQVRLKGNPDFSWWTAKMQFVVSFNEEDEDARFHGLRKLTFDAPWYDQTLLRDRLAWEVMNEVEGLPSVCTSSVTLDINGERYGAYTSIEYFDHEWLERNYGKAGAQGALWKYGTKVVANPEAANDAFVSRFFTASTLDDLDDLGSAEQFAAGFAAEAVLGDDDGYWCCQHNFYLYDHPTDGLLFIPWDMDDALEVMPYDADPVDGYPQPMGLFEQSAFLALVRTDEGRAMYRDALRRVLDAAEAADLAGKIDAWAGTVGPAVAEDPTLPFTYDEHVEQVARLRAWVVARMAYLESWLACDAGTPDDGDGDGYDDCDDPHDADATVHPGAAEPCNGIDDDADGVIDDDATCDDCVLRQVDDARYAFCRWPRSQANAEARCAEEGLGLGTMDTTADFYMTYFYTWPVIEGWWMSSNDGHCRVWDTSVWSLEGEDCEVEHPVVCKG